MASVKILSLVVRTAAKPIANTIKAQAVEHESFRNICISIAQTMHRSEARLRLGLLNEEAKNIKPLNDARAVQNGATFLAESFLFVVAAGLVLGETYRSSRKEKNRRDDVRERLEDLETEVKKMMELVQSGGEWSRGIEEIKAQNANLERVLTTVVSNGLKTGWLALGHNEAELGGSQTASSILPLLDPPPSTPSSSRSDASTSQILEQSAVLEALANQDRSISGIVSPEGDQYRTGIDARN